MSVYRREGSKYYYMVVPDGQGGTVRKSTKRTNRKEAELVAQQLIREAYDAEQLGISLGIELQHLSIKYLESKKLQGCLSYTTIEHFVAKLLGQGKWAGKYHFDPTLKIHELDSKMIQNYQVARQREGLKNKSINSEIEQLRGMHNFAKRNRYKTSPILEFKMLPTKPKERFLSLNEEAILLKELDPMRDIPYQPPWEQRTEVLKLKLQDQYDLAVMLLDTGQRYNEISRMPWTFIDVDNWETIYVLRSKRGKSGYIRMSNRLREVLQRRHKTRRNDYIFPSFTDPEGHRSYSPKGIKNAIERSGLNDDPNKVKALGAVTIHTLRDTFATKLVLRKVPLKAVQSILGHASIKSSEKYAHMGLTEASDLAMSVLDD